MTRMTQTVFAAVALAVALIPVSAAANESAGDDPYVVVLGIAQDGGYPQAGCRKECCWPAWEDPARRRYASCIAIVDPRSSQRWIVDTTPDFRDQLRLLDTTFPVDTRPGIDGILLSHAHVGHYTGLMLLGREVMGTKDVPVYALPRMYEYLGNNGPWSQLVRLGNIALRPMSDGEPVALTDRISVTPFLVPHRDEYTETAGFRIDGPQHSVLYISDIDKWHVWEESIVEKIAAVSVAYIDATFYAEGEIPGRNMADIPHPFIVESMALFEPLPAEEKAKIRFIHLNHTNPALIPGSDARARITGAGFAVAEQSETVGL